jgi:high-affinity nickel-transport protein
VLGGAICGAFIVFGGLSVLLYKPWRRRVDRNRVRNAHFEPLAQSSERQRNEEEELQDCPRVGKDGAKAPKVDVASIEVTDAAGLASGSTAR